MVIKTQIHNEKYRICGHYNHQFALSLMPLLVNCRYGNLNNGLAVIRDKVTPEEMSEVILNPRKRDLSALSTAQNQVNSSAITVTITKGYDIGYLQVVTARNISRAYRAVTMVGRRGCHITPENRFCRQILGCKLLL